ncbi:MAG: hemerythrin domain-containing protein [Vicinamibacterales bacterium]
MRQKSVAQKPSTLATATTTIRGAVAGAVTAITKRLPWSGDREDAIALLERDHRRFEDLLKQGEETTQRAIKGRTELLETLTAELNLHELVEEKILYPALKAHPEARDIVLEGYQEHHVADVLTRELHTMAADDERWGAKFKVLKESLEHHIQEEEGDMFRKARGIFSRDDLEALGAQMARMKAEVRP